MAVYDPNNARTWIDSPSGSDYPNGGINPQGVPKLNPDGTYSTGPTDTPIPTSYAQKVQPVPTTVRNPWATYASSLSNLPQNPDASVYTNPGPSVGAMAPMSSANPLPMPTYNPADFDPNSPYMNPGPATGTLGAFSYGTSGSGGGPSGGSNNPSSYPGTNVFSSDPSTAPFEQLLNKLIGNFSTSQTPADYGQAVNQLNTYLQQLNGPVYTPDQMNLLQTQALDPLAQQHDAARQQTIQRLAAQGIGPSSGITQQALADVDRSFEQMRTQTQAQFASNAVGLQRQNQATAAQLAPAISAFEQNQTLTQDQRNQVAATLAAIVPQLAQSRLSTANSQLNTPNIPQLLQALNAFTATGNAQGQAYGQSLGQILSALFGL